jgi:hypothetical protein
VRPPSGILSPRVGTLINKAGTFVLPFLGIYLVARRGYSVAGAGAVVSL